ncbi:transcriptional regulator, GntR family [Ruminiclostridium papyrosolvens DSM 2782]|uniref:Transcriptional regulator, GntR family n=1 Tax=Ruminiclostridium papyrosolvens DSM 2782 TaxID=588581 RepID=F1T706_9FIRM|nr:GntR family transcriptional regulator [Ruminiclostridium papyrosolvens]EGD49254.1 transcriptional regulator, GntR family [Ruminiclostridium papyrosolvens DSM 2782]WES33617.1 GntR family transcriptional regulator [Ruminiclostridium papyrosolvens DSM 2782]
MIQLDFKDPRPIYEQIKDKIKELVITGAVETDDKIPSVRELAQTLTINPNTIQKAYKDLEAEGIIYSVKGKGNFIAPLDKSSVDPRRKELLLIIQKTVEELIFLHTPQQAVIDIIYNTYSKKEASQ